MVRSVVGRADPLILMYHRVAHASVDPWGLAVDPETFALQMELFAADRSPVPLDWLANELRAGRRPRGVFAVTFDDGYRDVLEHAKPVLDRLDIPATMFLVTGAFGSATGFWWDRLASAVFGAATTSLARLDAVTFLTAAQRSAALRAEAQGRVDELHQVLWGAIRVLGASDRDAAVAQTTSLLNGPPAQSAQVMARAEVGALTAGGRFTIGVHTVTHPCLPVLTREEKR